MATAMVTLAHHVGAKSVREAVFLSTLPSVDLPKAMLVSALASMPLALLVTRAMTRWGLHIVAPVLFTWSSLLWGIEWLLLPSARTTVAVIVYLHVSVGGAILLSSFWSVASECFDPHSLKRLVGPIGAAGTIGGVIGGALIERTSRLVDTRSTMLALAGVCAVGGLLVSKLAQGHDVTSHAVVTTVERGSPNYLRCIGLLVFCSALVTTFADFALKQAVASRYSDAEGLVRYFALFYTTSSVVGFLVQVFVSSKMLEGAGVGATLAATPAAVLAFGSAAVMSPTLLPIAALKAVESSLSASLFRSAYEPLFAPIPAALKRSTKAILDVACDKGGDAIGALLVLLLAVGGASDMGRVPLLLACTAAVLAIYLSFRAQRGYVVELESSLRSGTLSIEDSDVLDPMARLTLSGTAIGLDRAKLLEYVAQFQSNGAVTTKPPRTEQLLVEIRTLVECDVVTAREVLRKAELDPRLAAFTIPLLAINGLAREATAALRTMGRPAVALMGDLMRCSDAPLVVRRRIPHVLRTMQGAQVVEVLTNALEVEQLVVRSRAALALREVLSQSSGQHPDPDRLLRLAIRETSGGPITTENCDHLLVLLVIGTGYESIDLVRQGIRTHDQRLRGTAIEFLESLLPESVRSVIVAALSNVVPNRRGQPRPQRELGDELARSVVGRSTHTDWSEDFE